MREVKDGKDMEITHIILLILEIIGTVSFAVSGSMEAIKAKLDAFGVLFVGCITAVGGGIIRDLLIGRTPPGIFSNLYILLIAALSSLIVFIIAYIIHQRIQTVMHRFEWFTNLFDALGLAAFSVTGVEIAFVYGVSDNAVLSVILGLFTGVGGGLVRDVLINTTPYIFKKHVYAIASIIGATVYYVIRLFSAQTLVASIVAMTLVVVIRLLAAKFLWSLPKVRLEEEPKTSEEDKKE
ncbi:MAG: trimeric intracellular cation channel family protein [Clostridia bacterium]|nr:trimeric intracellular cation channel family protein [Clostridia bacterium]